MLRKRQQFYYQVLQLVDALVLAGALCLAHALRASLSAVPLIGVKDAGPLSNYLWLLAIILPSGPFLLELQGLYRLDFSRNRWIVLGRIVRGVSYLWLLLLALIVFLRISNGDISRGVLLLFVPVAVSLLVVRDVLFRFWYLRHGLAERNRRNVMLCGSPEQCARWRQQLDSLPGRQFAVRGEVDLRIGGGQSFLVTLHLESIEIVIFELDHFLLPEVEKAIQACEAEGVEAWVTADFIGTSLARPEFDQIFDRPLLVFRTTPDSSWQLLLKEAVDRLGAAFLFLLALPLLAVLALVVRIADGSPVFFSQVRSGRHGKPFRMYKFRTMTTEAEQKKAELAAFNQMSGPVFKMERDPRITRLGVHLRRFSLDEFPQLWNVLRGEMSLVGPRPLPITETERFADFTHRRRLSVKPGLTCLWQVAGRSDITDFSDWVRLDLEYIDHWSIWSDFLILLRTIPVVLFGRGGR